LLRVSNIRLEANAEWHEQCRSALATKAKLYLCFYKVFGKNNVSKLNDDDDNDDSIPLDLIQCDTTVPHRFLYTSVLCLSKAASSIRLLRVFLVVSWWFQHTLSPQAFCVAGPSLWNSLLDSLRDPDLGRDSFRRLLKTHLFTLNLSI